MFADWLNEYLHVELDGWTQTRVAKEAGISTASMSVVMSGQQKPTFDFCAKVGRALNLPPSLVMQKAGLLGQPNRSPTFRELVTLLEDWSIEEQQEILDYARYKQSRRAPRQDQQQPDDAPNSAPSTN